MWFLYRELIPGSPWYKNMYVTREHDGFIYFGGTKDFALLGIYDSEFDAIVYKKEIEREEQANVLPNK